jgi:hypothetical protein
MYCRMGQARGQVPIERPGPWRVTKAHAKKNILSSEALLTEGTTCTHRVFAGVYALETGVGVPRVDMTYHERLEVEPGAGKCAVKQLH